MVESYLIVNYFFEFRERLLQNLPYLPAYVCEWGWSKSLCQKLRLVWTKLRFVSTI
jgi:hypothetical protein